MGFVTKSSMMSDYTLLFSDTINEYDLNLVIYSTPNGILIEIVKSEIDSQSVNEYVIVSKLIEFKVTRSIEFNINEIVEKVSDFEHKEGWEDE